MIRFSNTLFVSLASLIPVALVAACSSSPSTSSTGQMISCTTDPSTGVVLHCADDNGSADMNDGSHCRDMDTDGDGEPHDSDAEDHHGGGDANDDDGDGIPNDEDCDGHPGEDDHDGDKLPYDVRPQLGATTAPVLDAFAALGGATPTIVSVTMDGGSWRLAELQAGTSFVVTQDDCDHAGNRDIGRDRVVVTWDNADGTTSSDHLDIRYCKSGSGDDDDGSGGGSDDGSGHE